MKCDESGCGRKAPHSDEVKKRLSGRLRRVEGQIRGITRMIESDVYCDGVLNQIAAVESALKGVKQELLTAHMKSCIVDQILEGRIEVVDEVMKTVRRLMR